MELEWATMIGYCTTEYSSQHNGGSRSSSPGRPERRLVDSCRHPIRLVLLYIYPSGWTQNIDLAMQTHLFTLPAFEVLNMNLPVGDYTFFFGVDMTPNRKLDSPLYYSAVQVHVAP